MTRENSAFERRAWFKFNNLGLAQGMALKFYTSMTKGLKLKVRKFWGLIPTFVEVILKKLTARLFAPPPTPTCVLQEIKHKITILSYFTLNFIVLCV